MEAEQRGIGAKYFSKHRQWVARFATRQIPGGRGRAKPLQRVSVSGRIERRHLEKADLSGAQLIAAKLNKRTLSEALLSGLRLNMPEFNNADLSGANLDARFGVVELNDANLRTAT